MTLDETSLGELITAVIAGIGLVITVLSVKYVLDQMRCASVERLYGRMHDIHKVLLDKPKLRSFFYEGKLWGEEQNEEKGQQELEAQRQQLLIVSEMLADYFQQVFMKLRYVKGTTKDGWIEYMGSILINSPVLRDFVAFNEKWYPSKFVGEVLKELEKLNKEKSTETKALLEKVLNGGTSIPEGSDLSSSLRKNICKA